MVVVWTVHGSASDSLPGKLACPVPSLVGPESISLHLSGRLGMVSLVGVRDCLHGHPKDLL